MVKPRKRRASQETGEQIKPWPLVTSDTCEKCPIRCPAGVAYMARMKTGRGIGKGVVCKKELYLRRIQQGLHPFNEVPQLYRW